MSSRVTRRQGTKNKTAYSKRRAEYYAKFRNGNNRYAKA